MRQNHEVLQILHQNWTKLEQFYKIYNGMPLLESLKTPINFNPTLKVEKRVGQKRVGQKRVGQKRILATECVNASLGTKDEERTPFKSFKRFSIDFSRPLPVDRQ